VSQPDPTALPPVGSALPSSGSRRASARGRALVAVALLCLAGVCLLGWTWTVTQADPPASQPRDTPVTTSTTSMVPTSEAAGDGAPPATGRENRGGTEDSGGNGNGRGNGKGRSDGNGRDKE
jgi:hypothetical protein